jgi:hypothetical protein
MRIENVMLQLQYTRSQDDLIHLHVGEISIWDKIRLRTKNPSK